MAKHKKVSRHAPGPWRLQDEDVGGCRTILSADGTEIAMTPGLADDDADEANARLIIAAPELLEALKEMEAALGFGSEHPCVARARDAIDSVRVK